MAADTGTTNWPLDTDDLNLPSDMDTRAPTSAGDGHYTLKQWYERVTGMLRATAHDLLTAMTHDLPMNGHKVTGLPVPTASTEPLIKSQLDTDGTLAANSDTRVATQKAVKTYADALIAAADAMVFKGVIDCSANPNYPAADRGWTYRVSVAGKIGGASGTNVEVGDLLLCLTDGTASGTQAAVGTQWEIAQANVDGAVTGPASSTDNAVALFNGSSGKVVKDSGVILGALASKSTVASADITDGTIVDADVSGSAAIAKSKLASLAIVDADVSAISESKITGLTADLAAKAAKSAVVGLFVPLNPIASVLSVTGATLNGQNGAWQDLDLSASVPAGAIAVVLSVLSRDTTVSATAYSLWRRKGDTTGGIDANGSVIEFHSGVGSTEINIHITVGVDANRKCQYQPTSFSATGGELLAVVVGYYAGALP